MSFVSGIMEPIRSNTPRKERMLYDTFHEFKKLIIRHYSFLQHGKDKCCNYINYWLNKTVRDSKFGVDEKNFDIFDKFMRVDAKIKDSPIDCISKISYMKKDVFEKMEKLYDLYDYFTNLKENKVPTTLCHHINDLAEKYESIMKEYEEKDHNLCKMLTNLKDVIVKDELVANDVCTKNTSDLFYIKIDPPGKKQNTNNQTHQNHQKQKNTQIQKDHSEYQNKHQNYNKDDYKNMDQDFHQKNHKNRMNIISVKTEKVLSQRKYDVFHYLDVYENLDYQISTKYVSYQEATFCDNVDFDKNSNFELRKICKRFVMFFKKCFIQYTDNSLQSNNRKYPKYINYWLSY
ncbi:hypothetical protein PVMG_06011 [Plasmodium vivax Mauritania I]|uniref:Uncharacterized protein n=1 Tax=Plasmodium vivax Mauritania I TaxID=1035515 RepID=A0A0J9TIU6_PLAVI|nr:hypothetical protein PVMG_06011 [Plasmodium vivax Mauritania I]